MSFISSKRCARCGVEKSIDHFSKNKSKPDGYAGYCRACIKVLTDGYKQDKKDGIVRVTPRALAISLGLPTYTTNEPCPRGHICLRSTSDGGCLECKKITSKAALERTRNDPERNQRRLEGLRSWRERNKAHVKAYAKQWSAKTPGLHSLKWRQKNPEKVIAYTAEYNRHNKDKKAILESHRRARKAASEGSYTPSDIADIRRMQKDKCAYCKVKLKGRGHIDHIIPLARGGTNYRSNLQLTCRSCNCRKHAKHPIEFAQREGRLL